MCAHSVLVKKNGNRVRVCVCVHALAQVFVCCSQMLETELALYDNLGTWE